ncbi:hypothetical protein BUE80_DR005691 [Diplocarpon rosae]|nr:hypothetical protein BUE80_DR005691 [Diplocarpon rosae]
MDSVSDGKNAGLWEFTLARQFSRAFHSKSETATDLEIPDPALYNPKAEVPKSLGDFDRLFDFIGGSRSSPRSEGRRISTDSAFTLESSTPLSSARDDDGLELSDPKIKEVRWKDEEHTTSISKQIQHSRGDDGGMLASTTSHQAGVADCGIIDLDSDTEEEKEGIGLKSSISVTPSKFTIQHSILSAPRRSAVDFASVKLFRPATLLPLPILKLSTGPNHIWPIRNLTTEEQSVRLLKKLRRLFPDESNIDQAPSRLGITNAEGIHIFVDLSNIMIGFTKKLKQKRNVSEQVRIKQPPFSFRFLAFILERGRAVARRVVGGSTISSLYDTPTKLPSHLKNASELNYELNILERVSKPQTSTTPKKKKRGTGSGYVTSGYSSASESTAVRLGMQEQGVDEILQLKILESVVDSEKPSTVVLASGDAAEAEYSGGFLTMVERALRKGWKVEIVAWSQGLSYEYKRKDFLKKWENSFKIIHLDDYSEELLAIYAPKHRFDGPDNQSD